MKNKTRQAGFTLIELILVVMILGIIAAIGTTGLINYLPNMRLKGAARDIFSSMMQAKAEAIRRGENVTLKFYPPNDNKYEIFLDNGDLLTSTSLPVGITFGRVDLNNDGDFVDKYEVNNLDGVSFVNDILVFSSRGLPVGFGSVGLQATNSAGNIMRQRSLTVSIAGRIKIN
jgi:prepilin-type N-terminal cleavage/methylation domain-containing protein